MVDKLKNALYTVCSAIQYSVFIALQVGVLHKIQCIVIHYSKKKE